MAGNKVTIEVNGSPTLFQLSDVDKVTGRANTQTRLFKIPGFEKEWNIPLLYHYEVFNGRFSRISKAAHVCPCVVRYDSTHPNASPNDSFQEDCILLSIWRTRCVSPVIHLVVYRPGENNCTLIKDDTLKFLKLHYCLPNEPFDVETIKR